MRFMKIFKTLLLIIVTCFSLHAQESKVIDEVIAVIGDEIATKSETRI